jgi:hypothetical protein
MRDIMGKDAPGRVVISLEIPEDHVVDSLDVGRFDIPCANLPVSVGEDDFDSADPKRERFSHVCTAEGTVRCYTEYLEPKLLQN